MTDAHGGPPLSAPWQYVIEDAAGRVIAAGHQWTHPLAPAGYVAEERVAVYAYRMLRAGRRSDLVGVICRVWRPSAPDMGVTVSAGAWARRAGDGDRLRQRA